MKNTTLLLLNLAKYQLFKIKAPILIKKNKLKIFKNKHVGKRCFIIGNGPSLKLEDLENLRDEITLSCNMIHRFAKNTDWTPYYYFCHDPKYVKEFSSELAQVKCCHRFIGSYYQTYKNTLFGFSNAEHTSFYYLDKHPAKGEIGFSHDVSKKVMPGLTVSYAMIQFAFYMGFSEIYLIGFDHSFANQIENGKLVKSKKNDHFKGYGVVNNNIVNKDIITQAFNVAQMEADKKGIKIFNATRGGKLDVFERVDFDNLLPKS